MDVWCDTLESYSYQDVKPSEGVDDAMPVFEDLCDILRSPFMEG